jgi:hypothetical protein
MSQDVLAMGGMMDWPVDWQDFGALLHTESGNAIGRFGAEWLVVFNQER